MEIFSCSNPKQFLDLLLLADPYEPMIDRYLSQSTVLTAAECGKTIGMIVYCPVEKNTWEIKNLAVAPDWQGKGISKALFIKGQITCGSIRGSFGWYGGYFHR